MVERTGYADGEPCWVDVTTPDVDVAKRFYGDLFGWTFGVSGPEFGNYVMCLKDDHRVAGISPPVPGLEGLPSAWSIYLASADVEETARRVDRAGGKTMLGPMDIPGSGRMLFGFDPAGAAFGVWQGGAHIGSRLFGEPGSLCWAEINTREPAAVDAFYRALFDYSQEQIGDGQSFDYSAWSLSDGETVCGRLSMTADWDGISPHWMSYFAVDDTDRAATRATEAGGRVPHGPFDSPHGRIAVVIDPGGAVFSIIDPSTRTVA